MAAKASSKSKRRKSPRTTSVAKARKKSSLRLGSSRRRRWGFLLWGASGLVALVLLLLWSWVPDSSYQPSTAFLNGKSPADSPITYEEPLPRSASPAPDLTVVDEALFAALRRAGVPPQATHLALASGPAGEVSVLRAELPPGVSLKKVAASLKQSLARTRARSTWQATSRGRELLVSLAGRLTHKVVLLAPRRPTLPPPAPPSPPAPAPLPAGSRLALVIDDMGYQLSAAKKLLDLGLPITFSILPHAPYGRQIAEMARRRGLEVLVHLPMEPRGYPKVKPGPGALLTSMSPAQLRRTTLEDLATVPGARGANNHMGSRFTESEAALRPVLGVLAEKGLFFIDSLTSPKSRAYALARRLGLAAGKRTIFLDHDPRLAAVRRQLQRLITLAKSGSRMVAIGHPHPATIQALSEFAPRLKKEVRMVAASALLTGPSLAQRRKAAGTAGRGGALDSAAARP